MRERVLNGALVVLTLCAVTVTGLLVRREFFSAPPGQPPVTKVDDWREYARDGHRMGPANAPVTVVVFSDFQCRFCGVLMANLRDLRNAYPEQVAVVYRHFPLSNHEYAAAAARASECAQGRFEAFQDALFASQDSIGAISWDRFASEAGVEDLAAFRACTTNSAPSPALARDSAAGGRLRVSGTPTLLINDQRFQGAVPPAILDEYVRRALARRSGRRS